MMIEPGREEKLICGEDNIVAFNDAVRRYVPGFRQIAKELIHAGMIPGLRGAELIIHPEIKMEITNEPSKTCSECRHWAKDGIGDGTGIGQCLSGMRKYWMKWPGQLSCNQFEATR